MNAELLGIIAVGVILLCIGCVIIVETNDMQFTSDAERHLGPWTSSTRTDTCYPSIIPECR
jgi:hypothetical protein